MLDNTRPLGFDKKFKSTLGFFTSPNTTYNKLRSKERPSSNDNSYEP